MKLKLGLFSGLHGDEQGVIESVKKVLVKNDKLMSPYYYIPECSPSAIKLKTRLNGEKIDLNRDFTQNPRCQESKDIISKLNSYHFDICVDFHEDNQFPGVYIYDSDNIEGSRVLDSFRRDVQKICPLHSGVDDISDESLGYHSYLGYHSCHQPKKDSSGKYVYEGFLDLWALIENKTQRWITLEIPSKLPQNQKDRIVEIFFETILEDFLSESDRQ